MANFAQQLKNEISRISRKELRAETQSLKKASAQHRREVAALKRRIASLEAAIRALSKAQPQRARKEAAAEDAASLRFRAGGFASLRKKLGLSAAGMAKLLGVSSQSVYHWEQGKTRPRGSQLAAIAEVRKMGKKAAAARLAES